MNLVVNEDEVFWVFGTWELLRAGCLAACKFDSSVKISLYFSLKMQAFVNLLDLLNPFLECCDGWEILMDVFHLKGGLQAGF